MRDNYGRSGNRVTMPPPPKETEIARLRALLDDRDARIACQAERIDALLASTSWKVTKPLRACGEAWNRLAATFGLFGAWRSSYRRWIRRYDTLDAEARSRIAAAARALPRRPLISVIMPVYDPPPRFLDEAIRSVRGQLYPDWELCIADDASADPDVRRLIADHAAQDRRIKAVRRERNGHISRASNSALAVASGEFVALLDHDDLLAEHALYCVARAILDNPDAALIYSDEDKITADGKRLDPYFKCALNRELLLAQNMISHLGVYRRELVEEAGGFREGFEGSQDWDLALRVIARTRPHQTVHIPRVLYHWRAARGSTALASSEKTYAAQAGRRAVEDFLKQGNVAAEVLPSPEVPHQNRVRYRLTSPPPLASLIVPTRDHADVLRRCISSVTQKTTYPHYEIIIIDNESELDETARYLDRINAGRISVLRAAGHFNFSALNNLAAKQAKGDFLCLLNNDIEILTPDWLEEMVSVAMQPGVGAVGARLWYPEGGLQHGGVVLGIGGVAGHAHKHLKRGCPGYFGRAVLRQEFSAVTAACLVVKRQLFLDLGGLDEALAVTCNDVDFCLRLKKAGFRNIWTPYAEMIHHESLSRGTDETPEKHTRSAMEGRLMEQRWGSTLQADVAYSPNLTLEDVDFGLAWPPRVPPL